MLCLQERRQQRPVDVAVAIEFATVRRLAIRRNQAKYLFICTTLNWPLRILFERCQQRGEDSLTLSMGAERKLT